MADSEMIANQEALLVQHRRRLIVLLEQQARLGDYAPPHIRLDIEDAQRSIHEIKAQLRTWGIAVKDSPEDTAALAHAAATNPLNLAQALLDQLPLDRLPVVAPLPNGSRMPLSRNPLFVGREADLKQLAAMLKSGGTAASGQIAAATGLGGIGKTQLAAEFVHRYGQHFAGGVFWLSFADPAGVSAQVALCGGAGYLDLRPDFADLKIDMQVELVEAAWRQPIPRLLIFDNCEDEDLLARWRPPHGGCRLLMTSRRASWDASLGVTTHPLRSLPRGQSIMLLRTFRPDLMADDSDVDALAAELGDLPLALHLAGSFLKQEQPELTPGVYLTELRAAALLAHESLQGIDVRVSPTNHALHVGRTFALSYEKLDPADAIDMLALALLARAAHLAPGISIPRDLLLAMLDLPDSRMAARANRALRRLSNLGLIEVEGVSTILLHRLVSTFVCAVADEAARQAVEQALYDVVNRLNQAGNPAPVLIIQPHLRVVTMRAFARQDLLAARLCSVLDYHLTLVGDFRAARPLSERALKIREQILGPDHPEIAASLNNLGRLLHELGDLAGARPYLERALAIRQQVLGPDHPDTAASLNNLGYLLHDQGDLVGARPYLERALAIRQQVLGPDHPDTAASLNNFGRLLHHQGDLAGARRNYERALAIWEQALGADYFDTATSLNNLGKLLHDQRDLAQARAYYERALAIREHVLGKNHPDTAASLDNLGKLLHDQGDLARARSYYERALAIWEQALGSDHSDTRMVQENLAALERLPSGARGASPTGADTPDGESATKG
jgi:tetratricopeptide (TPR) repeat protein